MRKLYIPLSFIFTLSPYAQAGEYSPADFHRNVYVLHQQQIARHTVRIEQEKGDYEGASGAGYSYLDTHYYNADNGLLLSHVKRDASRPEFIHIVEVNIYENDKIVRDFGSVSLPWMPLKPVRTFINLHQYNGQLHSFRQYDVSGEVGYEFCEGKLKGKPVAISLEESDINATSRSTEIYKACFNGLNQDWAQYRLPH